MADYFLRANDEAELKSALSDASMLNEENEPITATHDYAMDIIGIIYSRTGETLESEEGFEYHQMEPLSGYHANFRGDHLPSDLAHLEIPAPDSPFCKWA